MYGARAVERPCFWLCNKFTKKVGEASIEASAANSREALNTIELAPLVGLVKLRILSFYFLKIDFKYLKFSFFHKIIEKFFVLQPVTDIVYIIFR